jgi:hypothetical protein
MASVIFHGIGGAANSHRPPSQVLAAILLNISSKMVLYGNLAMELLFAIQQVSINVLKTIINYFSQFIFGIRTAANTALLQYWLTLFIQL